MNLTRRFGNVELRQLHPACPGEKRAGCASCALACPCRPAATKDGRLPAVPPAAARAWSAPPSTLATAAADRSFGEAPPLALLLDPASAAGDAARAARGAALPTEGPTAAAGRGGPRSLLQAALVISIGVAGGRLLTRAVAWLFGGPAR